MTKSEEIANWLLTGEIEEIDLFEAAELIRAQAEQINNLQQWQKRQLDVIENLNGRIERMIENASHHEGIAHAGGFEQGHEAGRKLGMQQERALWELAASTQEIENGRS